MIASNRLWVKQKYALALMSKSRCLLSSLSSLSSSRPNCRHLSSTGDSHGRGGKSSDPDAKPENLLRPKFYVPKGERGGNRSVYEMCTMMGETRMTRNSRTCPTRELYFLHAQWHRHKSPYRKFRHMANLFRAAPFQRLLFPELFCITTVAGCLTYYNEFAACGQNLYTLSMSPSAFAGATTAIGLLAGFRLNASVGRVKEGRKAWSDASTATRDLARQIMMWMKHDKDAQTRMLRLSQAFPIALMFSINDKGCHHNMKRKSKTGEATFQERVQAEFRAELYDVYHRSEDYDDNDILKKDFQRFCRVKLQGGNTPLEILTCMGETIAACDSKVNPIYIREIDVQIQRLSQALGSSERIVKTPLPTGFTRHSSRLLLIWSNCLPFALYPLLGPFGTLPTSLLTAYAVLGIEDISVQLEEPFDILPLRQYSDSIYDGIAAIEQSYTSYSATAMSDEEEAKHE